MMKKIALALMMLATVALTTVAARAQDRSPDLVGNWQGTLQAGKAIRVVLQIAAAGTKGGHATLYIIDQSPDGIAIPSLTLQGSNLRFAIPAIAGASYEGTVSADGSSIPGTWTQGKNSLPLTFQRATKETAWPTDSSPHSIQFVTVNDNVKLEVLDWGGSGRPLLLAGLGDTAHRFDKFAPKLTGTYHVYGITRRGFGASSAPVPANNNYTADRLGDDVLTVLDALKLSHPVLAGHSIAGEEMSSIATRYPEKVAGLIYLDAAYQYAFYDRSRGDLNIDSIELRKKLAKIVPGMDQTVLMHELLQTTLPQFERDLQEQLKTLQVMPVPPTGTQMPLADLAVMGGEQKYTDVCVPVLAFFAVPHDMGPAFQGDPAARAAAEASDLARTGTQADAFEKGIPSARVVRLPHANHYVFLSNEADVLREMNAFIGRLP